MSPWIWVPFVAVAVVALIVWAMVSVNRGTTKDTWGVIFFNIRNWFREEEL
jgi:hypothetical protein